MPSSVSADEHLAAIGGIGRARDQPGVLEPVEDLRHAAARPHHDLAQLGRRHAVRFAHELEHAEHRVVDEPQPERVEATVLERFDEQADAREPGEQTDRAGLRQVRAPRSPTVTAPPGPRSSPGA